MMHSLRSHRSVVGSTMGATVSATRELVLESLAGEELGEVGALAARIGVSAERAAQIGSAIGNYVTETIGVAELRATLANPAHGVEPTAVARYVLLQQVLRVLDEVPTLPVSQSVRRLFLTEFAVFARPEQRDLSLFAIGSGTFASMCREASLRRFPAGQLHWEVSGVERRSVLRAPWRDRPHLLHFLMLRMKGFGPHFVSHLNGHRKNRFLLVEEESNRSYYRMARSMELQRAVKGFATVAWFHGPDIATTAPHLAWTNRVILENGGLVVSQGPAPPDSGFLENNRRRRQAFEDEGRVPLLGLVLWPRQAMLAWARANADLDD